MRIGIRKEIMSEEKRVAAIPETVAKYCRLGFKVMVEKGAGADAFYSDTRTPIPSWCSVLHSTP